MAEPLAVGRPLDQPGDVGHREGGAVVGPHHAQVGLEGGERVVGDLGPGSRDPGDEGALAHIGEPDQGHVGDQGQFEVVPLLVALLPLLGEGRCPPPVGEEAGVTPPAAATLAGQPPVARPDQVHQDRPARPPGPGAHRHRHLEIGAVGPVLLLATPVTTVAAPAMGVVAEAQQRRLVGGGHHPHVTSPPAVAAVGTAFVDVGLPPEGDRAGPAVARLHMELRLVDEAGHGPILLTDRLSPGRNRLLRPGQAPPGGGGPRHRSPRVTRPGPRSRRSASRWRPGTPPSSRA